MQTEASETQALVDWAGIYLRNVDNSVDNGCNEMKILSQTKWCNMFLGGK